MNTKMKQCHNCGALMSGRAKKCFRCGSYDLIFNHHMIVCPTCGMELEFEGDHGECAFCGDSISIQDHYIIHSKFRGDSFETYH